MPGKRGAIFDWDGVIINSAVHHERSWERLAKELGRPLPADHFQRGFGMRNETIIPDLLGWTTDAAEIQTIALHKERLYREIVREQGVTALPGVETFLRRLRDAGVPCVIGSSTHRENITVTLDVLGLADFFSDIVSGEDVKRGKPDPEVFVLAGQRIGVGPGEGVVFEDALVGVAAGRAAGMKVVGVTTTNPRELLHEADLVVDRLDELTVAQLWPEGA